MAYFVTGATGFIGRFLVDRLLEERKGDIHVLVREGSEGKLERFGRTKRLKPVRGDLGEPGLGIDPAWIDEHKGTIDHVFHLAAIYDMTAARSPTSSSTTAARATPSRSPTRSWPATCTTRRPSPRPGLYQGTFTEDMFDEGQPLDHPYHRTKFESERIAREESEVPWRVYRPGDRARPLRDGRDGQDRRPLLLLQGAQARLEAARTSCRSSARAWARPTSCPVDFVADAMDHIAHQPGPRRPGVPPRQPASRSRPSRCSTPSRGSPARRASRAVLPRAALSAALEAPGPDRVLRDLGIPPATLDYADFTATLRRHQTTEALEGSGIAVPRPRGLRAGAVALLGGAPRLVRGSRSRRSSWLVVLLPLRGLEVVPFQMYLREAEAARAAVRVVLLVDRLLDVEAACR